MEDYGKIPLHNLCKFLQESGVKNDYEVSAQLREHCISKIENPAVAAGIADVFPEIFRFVYRPIEDDFMQFTYADSISSIINFLTLKAPPTGFYGFSKSSEIVKGHQKKNSTYAKRNILKRIENTFYKLNDDIRCFSLEDRNYVDEKFSFLENAHTQLKLFFEEMQKQRNSEIEKTVNFKKKAVEAFMHLQKNCRGSYSLALFIRHLSKDLEAFGFSQKGKSIFSTSKSYKLDLNTIRNELEDEIEFEDDE